MCENNPHILFNKQDTLADYKVTENLIELI